MNNSHSSRRDFLKNSAIAGAAASLAGLSFGCATNASTSGTGPVTLPSGVVLKPDLGATRPRPDGQQPVHDLTTNPLERVRVGFIGCGGRGSGLVQDVLGVEFADVVAVCDLRPARANSSADRIEKTRGKRPEVFGGTEHIWEKLAEMDGIDVIYIATPWEWHAPMALGAMEHGKHAFMEVSGAVTVDDCWRLVDTSERTRRHCLTLENCCYGENELFLLNMAREGVFGDLNHGECAYLHDLRALMFDLNGEGGWRRAYHSIYNGNLYPTHGLGPVAQYMGIGRGDQFKYLVSMSSPPKGLAKWRDDHNPNNGAQAGEKYICGDMNTSLIKTELGRTIMLQHDVSSPRPYSRINALYGSGAIFFDYPARLSINEPQQYGLDAGNSEAWLNDADMQKMRDRFTHPLWRKLAERAKNSGHGGMDFVENWRHLSCIHQGATPDIVVYDAAAWGSMIEISSLSVATGSMPVPVPDFTRGLWKNREPLGIVEKSA